MPLYNPPTDLWYFNGTVWVKGASVDAAGSLIIPGAIKGQSFLNLPNTLIDSAGILYATNKAFSGWLPWATRDVSGAEAVMNLAYLGSVQATGQLIVTPLSGVALGQGLRLNNGGGGHAWELKAGYPGVSNDYFTITDRTRSDAVCFYIDPAGDSVACGSFRAYGNLAAGGLVLEAAYPLSKLRMKTTDAPANAKIFEIQQNQLAWADWALCRLNDDGSLNSRLLYFDGSGMAKFVGPVTVAGSYLHGSPSSAFEIANEAAYDLQLAGSTSAGTAGVGVSLRSYTSGGWVDAFKVANVSGSLASIAMIAGMTMTNASYIGIGTSNNATVGSLRFSNAKFMAWRNQANTANVTFAVGIDDYLASSAPLKCSAYGAGTLSADASGYITSSSDARLKDRIHPFLSGLDAIRLIEPVYYHWNETSHHDHDTEYVGLLAQNVLEAIPEAVGQDENGHLTLQDRPLIAALVNAVKEQQTQIDALQADVAELKRMVSYDR